MKKRILACVLAVFVVLAAFPLGISVSAETISAVVCDCDTLDGWTKTGGNKLEAPGVPARSQGSQGAIQCDVSYGAFRTATYTLDSAMDISGYDYIEWDAMFFASGDTTGKMWDEVKAAYGTSGNNTLLLKLMSEENDSDRAIWRLSALEYSQPYANLNWVHFKAPLDKANTVVDFDATRFKKFYFTSCDGATDGSVSGGQIRLDNIKVTGEKTISVTKPGDANADGEVNIKDYVRIKRYLVDKTVSVNPIGDISGNGYILPNDLSYFRAMILNLPYEVEEPEIELSKVISDCESATGWGSESGGAGVALAAGRGKDSTGAIYAFGGYGALRKLTYTLPSAMDISAFTTLEWDMQSVVQSGANQGKDNFEAIADAYGDYMAVEISDGTNKAVLKLNKWEVGETGTGNYRHFKVSVAGTGVDLSKISSFTIYSLPNGTGAVVNTVESTIFRFDNVIATNSTVTPNWNTSGGGETGTTKIISDCESATGWGSESDGAGVALAAGRGKDSTGAIYAFGGYGALRKLTYTLPSTMDISAFTTLEWDMQSVVQSGTNQGKDNFEAIADAYGDYMAVEISDGTNKAVLKLNKWEVGETGTGNYRHFKVSVAGTGVDLSKISSFTIYSLPNGTGAVVNTVESTIFRFDNVIATNSTVTPNWNESGGEDGPSLDPVMICDCETNTGWAYELGGSGQTGSNMGIAGNYVALSANKGALRKFTYTAPSSVDITDYTTLQWDMVLKSSSSGSDYFYAVAEAYEDYIGVTVTDNSGKSVDFGIGEWQIGNISGDWRTMSVSLVGKGLNLGAIASISFYTLPANTGSINNNLDNIVVRLDNIKATTNKVTPNWDNSITTDEPADFMPKLFSDGMLFQQNKPMNVWGKTDAGKTVEVKLLNGNSQVAVGSNTADNSGNWSVALPAQKGGYTAYTLEVRENGTLKKTVKDVLIGELWVSSGQSNMEFFLGNTVAVADRETIKSNKYIRIFKEPSVPTVDGANGVLSSTPVYDIIDDVNNTNSVGHGTWINGTANYSELCYVSAIAYKTVVKLQAELDVPVGFINTARGSSVIEAWLSRDSIDSNATIKSKLQSRGAYYSEKALGVAKNWQFMTTLYNTKLAPIAGMDSDNTKLSAHSGMNIAGVMWYQGESNIKYAESNGKNTYYTAALNQLIDDWSVIFGFEKGKMPFIFAHIAPCDYSSVRTNDYDSAVAQLSAAMNESWAAHKDTAIQIPIYDLPLDYTLPAGYANQAIHPWQKQPVADRFAATILGKFYGGNTSYDAPVYKSSTISGNTVRITMDNIGSGLKSGSGNTKLFGFTICGADHKFVNADARLEGNTIIVSSPFVTTPVAAAYGFNTFNTNANLYNSYNLPAVPFYTAEFTDAIYLGDHDDWMSCDYNQVWRDNGIVTGNYVDTWKASNTTGSTVTFDRSVKYSGNSAVKVVTTSGNRGASPVLKPSAVTAYRQHFTDYKYISVMIKNGGTSAINVRLQIGSGNYATVSGSTASTITVAPGGFIKRVFDISNLVNGSGNPVTVSQAATAFSQNNISIIAVESGSTFYIDDIHIGA